MSFKPLEKSAINFRLSKNIFYINSSMLLFNLSIKILYLIFFNYLKKAVRFTDNGID